MIYKDILDKIPGIRLRVPDAAQLVGYEAALAAGWAEDDDREIGAAQLAWLREDRDGFLRELLRQDGTAMTPDGREVARIPFRIFWLDDGDFCGAINLRFRPGSESLPDYVSGHVGYAVVPWKQRRGFATQALGLILPVAREVGLRRVLVTCDEDNFASRKVILANGGLSAGARRAYGRTKLQFWIATDR